MAAALVIWHSWQVTLPPEPPRPVWLQLLSDRSEPPANPPKAADTAHRPRTEGPSAAAPLPNEPAQARAEPAPSGPERLPSAPHSMPADLPPSTPSLQPAAAVVTPAPEKPPAPPTAPRLLRVGELRYLVPPLAELPRLSRRAGESGVVWLRVRVDAQGRPVRIQIERSSGHWRLDEQALAAMEQARFEPLIENGVPREADVLAPIEYPSE